MKYILNYDIDEKNSDFLKKQFQNFDPEYKNTVLSYMKAFKPILFTSMFVVDIITNTDTKKIDNGYSDGEYIWYESEIYYFEKYNLKLNDDFIKHILGLQT